MTLSSLVTRSTVWHTQAQWHKSYGTDGCAAVSSVPSYGALVSVELMMHGTTHTLLSQRKTPRKDVFFERVLKALLEPLRRALRDAKMDDATQLWDNLPSSPEELGCEPQQGVGRALSLPPSVDVDCGELVVGTGVSCHHNNTTATTVPAGTPLSSRADACHVHHRA